MKTLLDSFGNDLTRLYLLNDYDEFEPAKGRNLEENKDKIYFAAPYLSFGDYDNSCEVERSNVRVFLESFGESEDIRHNSGIYGHESIYVKVTCSNPEIIEVLETLENYPVIDEIDLSLMSLEMFQNDWECWIEQEFKDLIFKEYDLLDINCDESELLNWFNELTEEANTYYEVQAGGNGYIDLNRINFPEKAPEFLKAEYY